MTERMIALIELNLDQVKEARHLIVEGASVQTFVSFEEISSDEKFFEFRSSWLAHSAMNHAIHISDEILLRQEVDEATVIVNGDDYADGTYHGLFLLHYKSKKNGKNICVSNETLDGCFNLLRQNF